MGEKRVIEQVASNEVHNDDWFLKDSPTQDTSKISATNLKAILGADGTLALEEIASAIAEEYDSTHTYYNTGLVFHEGVLYQCTASSVTGTWDSTKWNAVDIKDLLDNVSTNISYLWNVINNTIADNYDTSSTYDTGDYVIYSLKLYRCKADSVTGAWNSSKWDEVNIPEYIDYVLENAGIVKDVKVDGTSVVNEQGKAEIEIPVKDVQVKTSATYDSVVDASGNAKIDLTSEIAYGEASGAIASFSDGADNKPLKKLEVAIEPQQDLHGYDSPWVGGAGKNKCDTKGYGGIGYNGAVGTEVTFVDSTIPVTVNGNKITYSVPSWSGVVFKTASLPSGTYHFHAELSSTVNRKTFYVLNSNNVVKEAANYSESGGTLDISRTLESGDCIAIWIGSNNAVDITITNMQVESGNSYTTFAPYSNICPISGWDEAVVTRCGKNLASVNSATAGSGNVNIYNGIGIQSDITISFKCNNFSFTNGGASIAVIVDSNNQSHPITPTGFGLSANTVYNNRVSGTYNIDYKFKRIFIPTTGYTNMSGSLDDIQIELGTTATTYEPYAGNTYTIDLDGTRYGGTLDVVSGTLVVDRKFVTYDGSSDENWVDNMFQYGYSIQKGSFASNVEGISNYLKYSFGGLSDGSYYIGTSYLNVRLDFITSLTDFKSYLSSNPLQICSELATSTTVQLTPTQVKSLLGVNNIWADTGDINECVYMRDMNTTINDIIARIEALENA